MTSHIAAKNSNLYNMTAAETRRQHIDQAREDMGRLTNALATLRANTSAIPDGDWSWAGDWQSISAKIGELADTVERAAEISDTDRARRA